MGNIVGSIHWEKTSEDNFYIHQLNKLRKKHNLNEAAQFRSYRDMNNYGVEIVGLSILWYGDDNSRTKIKAFLYDASKFFDKNNIKYKTEVEHLPY